MHRLLRIVARAGVLGLMGAGAAWAAPTRVAGTIASVAGNAIAVTTADGKSEHVSIDDHTQISVRALADHSVLEDHAFVGVTATTQADGTLLASRVYVFPEARRGSGEGHYPMNGPAGTTMTNATVKAVSVRKPSSMTNATVSAESKGDNARRLTLTYKGGTQTVIVPDDVPVISGVEGNRATLVSGAHVIVGGERVADGSVMAARISVGAHGAVPPM